MKKALSILMAMSLLCAQSLSLCVKAEEVGVTESCTEEPIITAAYLIENEYLYVSNSNGRLYVYGSTTGVCPMASIGIKDIVVERSSNGTSGWTAVAYPADYLKANVASCEMQKWITVSHGYYYRVTCNHYALETGWFPKTQSEGNTSNIVYI